MNKFYKYTPDSRPTPMIAYYDKINQNIWMEKTKYEFGKFINKNQNHIKHFWLMNTYIIFDESTNTVISYKFNEFESFVWLLRIINKPLKIEINKEHSNKINIYYKNEFILI